MPHFSSRQQRIIAAYLEGGIALDTTLQILDATCVKITQATMGKLKSLAAEKNKKAAQLLEKIAENEDILTEWEYDFVNDLADKPEDYRLSEKQNEILNRISQKINSR